MVVPPAGAVLDDELLAQALAQPFGNEPRDDVCAAAGGKRHDDPHHPLGILGAGRAGREREA